MKAFAALGSDSPLLFNSLQNRGYKVVSLPRFSLLSSSVARHADMLFSRIGNTVFTSSAYIGEASELFDALREAAHEIVLDTDCDFSSYPQEARFNVLFCGGRLYGNTRAVSRVIRSHAHKNGIPTVHVNQGYAACSCAVCGNGVITADPSLYAALTENAVPCLRITEGNVRLDGYSHGFIGGACGYSSFDNTLYFCGDITLHPDCAAIGDFAREMGVEVVSLCGGPLTDIGGIAFF